MRERLLPADPAVWAVLPAGTHRVAGDGRASDGTIAPAGTYFVRMEAGGIRSTRKVVHLR